MLDSFLVRVSAIAGGVALLVVAATIHLGPWLVPVLGLALVLIVGGLLAVILHAARSARKAGRGWLTRRSAPQLEAAPTGGPSQDLRLFVTNRGRKTEFHATATVVAARKYRNDLRKGSYSLLWLGRATSTISLDTNQSHAILIARFILYDHIPQARMGEARVIECNGSQEAEWDGFRWNLIPTEPLPEFDIDVTIVGVGHSEPFIRKYTLRPSGWLGPLELIER